MPDRRPIHKAALDPNVRPVELKQPIKPRPYYVDRGSTRDPGYARGVIVVTLGPGGLQGVGDDWPTRR
jgi:hypothetical protein